MKSYIEYSKLPDGMGYIARPRWAGAVACYVRREASGWATAAIHRHGYICAKFTTCPVAEAADTRHAAVMAFDYYFNTLNRSAS